MRKFSPFTANQWAHSASGASPVFEGRSRLEPLEFGGTNPGQLDAFFYAPKDLPEGSPLVVVLHGCGQTAASYDHGSGWTMLAERYGFSVLFPQQTRANNPNGCFNWFTADDTRRGGGEALSIRQMIDAMSARFHVASDQIFITGLSAGGAMASVMLATYPEVFAGGAIIAGLPYGTARGVPQALDRMRGAGSANDAQLAGLVRQASDHDGPWPKIAVWHGSGDQTVSPSNAAAILAQWCAVIGVSRDPDWSDTVDGYSRDVWLDDAGRTVIEFYDISGLGHGTPLDTRGEHKYGAAGAFMLEAGISSTFRIGESWGLTVADARHAATSFHDTTRQIAGSDPAGPGSIRQPAGFTPAAKAPLSTESYVKSVIDQALRAAGLQK